MSRDNERPDSNGRLDRQVDFLVALDGLKHVQRRNLVMGGARRENSAEHSWHAAVMAMVLADHAPEGTDVCRATRMMLVHDVIEIEAGDTFCYDEAGKQDVKERERSAADHIFGKLPDDVAAEMRGLWDEFEARQTPEARFANAMDRFQVLFQNLHSEGGTWRLYDIDRARVEKRMAPVREAAPGLWPTVEAILDKACAEGWLKS